MLPALGLLDDSESLERISTPLQEGIPIPEFVALRGHSRLGSRSHMAEFDSRNAL